MIRKVKTGYRVMSHDGKRNLGTYKTKQAAEVRLAKIEALKHARGK